mgnify:CR=1 FL=1
MSMYIFSFNVSGLITLTFVSAVYCPVETSSSNATLLFKSIVIKDNFWFSNSIIVLFVYSGIAGFLSNG